MITFVCLAIVIAALVFLILVDRGKIPMGDCTCGGKYYYEILDGQIDKHVYRCNQCGNQVI